MATGDEPRALPDDAAALTISRRQRFAGGAAICTVAVLAALTRAHRMHDLDLSFDESFVLKMTEFPWSEMLPDRISRDTHPPLLYLLLKPWRALFGPSIEAARMLMVLCGAGSAVGMYCFVVEAYRASALNAREYFRRAQLPAFVAATLLALAPLQIFWTAQIRMYGPAILLTVWSSYLLMRALRREGARRTDWIAFTGAAVLLVHTHYYGLFIIAAQYLFAAGHRLSGRSGDLLERLTPVLLSAAAFWLLCQPWAPYFLEQRSRVADHFYLERPSWRYMGEIVHELWFGYARPHPPKIGLIALQTSAVALIVLLAGGTRGDVYLALAAVLPTLAPAVISLYSRPILAARYLQFSQVFVLAAVAVLVCRLPRFLGIAAGAALIGAATWLYHDHYVWRQTAADKPGMQAAIADYEQGSRSGEPLVIANPMLFTSAVTYARQRDRIVNYLPPRRLPFFQGTPVMRDREFVDDRWIANSQAGHLWTLGSHYEVPMPAGWILLRERSYPGWYSRFTLRLYKRNRQ